MTGLYVRVKREGKWQPIEIDQLADAELSEFFQGQEKDNGLSSRAWAICLAKWIRDNVTQIRGADLPKDLE